MFVFAGLSGNNSDASLSVLLERLESKFKENEIAIQFTRKDELLLARFDKVSYYISFLKNKRELKDWYQMAKDFELVFEKKPVTRNELINRYNKLENLSSNLYKNIYYAIGLTIMEEMEKFSAVTIYAFQ